MTSTAPVTPAPGEDPAVLAWRIALAPRARFTTNGRHWWRDMVVDAWRSAHHAWWLQMEAEALGYATEQKEFREKHPEPQLKWFMQHLSTGGIDPYHLLADPRPEGAAA